MSPFEYLSVFISVIVGLGVSHLLVTAARLIQHRRKVRPYVPTYVWLATLFIIQIQIWWVAYDSRNTADWDFVSFLGILVIPIFAFLLSYLAVPELEGEAVDLRASYFENRLWFLGMITAMVLFSFVRDLSSGGIPLDVNTAFRIVFLVCAVAAMVIRRPWFHALNAWVALLLFCGYVAAEFLELR